MSGAKGFRSGDVVRYDTLTMPSRHCREGWAIAKERNDGRVVLLDTFWGSTDNHVLTDEEVATAELVFNLADYDEFDQYDRSSSARWETYKREDRETVTSQHGLQRRWFVRKGAEPDLATQIENARQVLEDAERKLESAEWRVRGAKQDLEQLEAKS